MSNDRPTNSASSSNIIDVGVRLKKSITYRGEVVQPGTILFGLSDSQISRLMINGAIEGKEADNV